MRLGERDGADAARLVLDRRDDASQRAAGGRRPARRWRSCVSAATTATVPSPSGAAAPGLASSVDLPAARRRQAQRDEVGRAADERRRRRGGAEIAAEQRQPARRIGAQDLGRLAVDGRARRKRRPAAPSAPGPARRTERRRAQLGRDGRRSARAWPDGGVGVGREPGERPITGAESAGAPVATRTTSRGERADTICIRAAPWLAGVSANGSKELATASASLSKSLDLSLGIGEREAAQYRPVRPVGRRLGEARVELLALVLAGDDEKLSGLDRLIGDLASARLGGQLRIERGEAEIVAAPAYARRACSARETLPSPLCKVVSRARRLAAWSAA